MSFNFCELCFVFCVSAMPCKENEQSRDAPDEALPCTPPRPSGNAGAGRYESDADNDLSPDSDSDQLEL